MAKEILFLSCRQLRFCGVADALGKDTKDLEIVRFLPCSLESLLFVALRCDNLFFQSRFSGFCNPDCDRDSTKYEDSVSIELASMNKERVQNS